MTPAETGIWPELAKQGIFAVMLGVLAVFTWKILTILIDGKNLEIARLQEQLKAEQKSGEDATAEVAKLNEIMRESLTETVTLGADAIRRTQEIMAKVEVKLEIDRNQR